MDAVVIKREYSTATITKCGSVRGRGLLIDSEDEYGNELAQTFANKAQAIQIRDYINHLLETKWFEEDNNE